MTTARRSSEYSGKTRVTIRLYQGELDVDRSQLVLNEGWDMALATLEEIERGDRYSEQANQVRPLGKPHQRLLLDFIQHNNVQHNRIERHSIEGSG